MENLTAGADFSWQNNNSYPAISPAAGVTITPLYLNQSGDYLYESAVFGDASKLAGGGDPDYSDSSGGGGGGAPFLLPLVPDDVRYRNTIVAMLIMFSIVGTICNALSLAVISRESRVKTSTVLIASLAVTDLCTCALIMPASAYMLLSNYVTHYEIVCHIYYGLAITSVPYSAIIVAGIAIDRLCYAIMPYCHVMRVTAVKVFVSLAAVATLAFAILSSLSYSVYRPLRPPGDEEFDVTNSGGTEDNADQSSLSNSVNRDGYSYSTAEPFFNEIRFERSQDGLIRRRSYLNSDYGSERIMRATAEAQQKTSNFFQSTISAIVNSNNNSTPQNFRETTMTNETGPPLLSSGDETVYTGQCAAQPIYISIKQTLLLANINTAIFIACMAVTCVAYFFVFWWAIKRRLQHATIQEQRTRYLAKHSLMPSAVPSRLENINGKPSINSTRSQSVPGPLETGVPISNLAKVKKKKRGSESVQMPSQNVEQTKRQSIFRFVLSSTSVVQANSLRLYFKTLLTVFLVTVVFVASTTPALLVKYGLLGNNVDVNVLHLIFNLHYINSWANPFIYYAVNDTFRANLTAIVRRQANLIVRSLLDGISVHHHFNFNGFRLSKIGFNSNSNSNTNSSNQKTKNNTKLASSPFPRQNSTNSEDRRSNNNINLLGTSMTRKMSYDYTAGIVVNIDDTITDEDNCDYSYVHYKKRSLQNLHKVGANNPGSASGTGTTPSTNLLTTTIIESAPSSPGSRSIIINSFL